MCLSTRTDLDAHYLVNKKEKNARDSALLFPVCSKLLSHIVSPSAKLLIASNTVKQILEAPVGVRHGKGISAPIVASASPSACRDDQGGQSGQAGPGGGGRRR